MPCMIRWPGVIKPGTVSNEIFAHEDMLLRGPGEYLGARQSGMPLLRFADLVRDEELVRAARVAADLMLDRHPAEAARHVARWLGGRADLMAV